MFVWFDKLTTNGENNMRTLALDIGDRWTGVAISDPLGILARPYDTAKTTDLYAFLEKVVNDSTEWINEFRNNKPPSTIWINEL